MADPKDLCTLEDVRRLMQTKDSTTTQDPLVQQLITSASVAVMRKTEREFAPAAAEDAEPVARVFEWPWDGGQFVSLAPYDLVSVESVEVDTDQASSIELSGDEYRLWPQPPRDGTYMAIRLQPFSAVLGRAMWRNRQVTITGTWGFPEIPEDVAHATALTVVHWVNVNSAVFQRPDDNPDGYSPPKRGIPPEALELLGPYRRPMVA